MDFKNEIKRAAENQWSEIISKICNIDSKILDGRNGPCPKCGGVDRFRMIDKKAGALLCNQCFSTKNGDGLAAIMWLNGCDFPTALNQVAEFLNIKRPTGLSKPAAKKPAVDFGLEFTDWNSPLAKLFCLKKKPISESALLSIGAKQAIYRFHNQSFKVIAIPTTQPDSEKPVGWTIYNITGGTLPRKSGSKISQVKTKLAFGSKPGIIGRLDPDATTIIKTEGPTDLLAMLSIDLPAGVSVFSNANGCMENPAKSFSWLLEFAAGKNVFVLHDCDEPGQQGATVIQQNGGERAGWAPFLANAEGATVKNIVLPYPVEPTSGKDVRDYINEGNSYNALESIFEAATVIQPVKPNADNPIVEDVDDPHRLARENLEHYKNDHNGRLVFWRDEWWKYKNGCYKKIEVNELRAKITAAIRREFEICFQSQDADDVKPIKKVTRGLVTNVIGALESMVTESANIQMPSWLPDRSVPNLLSMKNGLLDLTATFAGGELEDCLKPHSPDWFSSFRLDYDFDMDNHPTKWIEYIDFVTSGDQEKAVLLQEWAGYLLWPTAERQSFLVFEGEGGTGKSSFFAGMAAMLGEDNVSSLSLEDMGESFGLASTVGKVANIAGDVGSINGNEEAILKRYTGGDKVEIQRKFLNSLSLRPTAKLMMAWNQRPRFRDKSDGLWRRMILIPLDNQVGDKRIFGMDNPKYWDSEAAGIMRWALAGLSRLLKQNSFSRCKSTEQAIAEFRDEVNPIREFFADFVVESDGNSGIESRNLYSTYRHWCIETGHKPLSDRAFGKQLKSIFPAANRKRIKRERKLFWHYENIEFTVDEVLGQSVIESDIF